MRAILHFLIVGYLAQQTSPELAVLEGRLLHQGSSAPIANASISLARLNPNMPETSEAVTLAQSVAVLMRSYATSRDVLFRTTSMARTTIVVRDTDVRGILITIAEGGTLQGEIFIDGNTTQDTRRERFSLRLRSPDSMPDMLAAGLGTFRFSAEGKLIASNVPIARYSLEVLGLPPGAYVSDIRQSGQSVYNDGVLIDMAYKTAMTDDAGRFSLAGVMPGTYTIFALKSRPYRQPWLNPAFISRYEDRARVVRVETLGSTEIQLPLITD